MSRALTFLTKARPEAMGAYFAFLKDNGSRLEPKTRALISVITKAAVQTEKGLLQYTTKALEAGATPEEILDALMMAFPALGLSRIVWAVDVLIDNGVEGFGDAADTGPDGEEIDVCALDALPPGRTVKVRPHGHPVLLTRVGDGVRAHRAVCTHQGMELMESGIRGTQVTCAQHGWTFDLPEGSCPRGEKFALAELGAEVRAGRVFVRWQD